MKSQVRIVSRYVGGGFGGKLPVFADVILSALAARELGRPVKTALTRQQMVQPDQRTAATPASVCGWAPTHRVC